MKKVRERLDAARKAETARIEERKNSHIERLMKAHEKAFAEIKNYYNDITHNNLDLIRSLKEEVRPRSLARGLACSRIVQLNDLVWYNSDFFRAFPLYLWRC